ncbi:MAG: carbon starvation protein A [Lentisphaerae bacterium]|nr:carbon starvation protein A [Lentisphaerota bacterium]
MMLVPFVVGVVLFLLAYRFYGARIATWLGLDDTRPTPSHTRTDGVDYVPTSSLILFGHHFSTIAGAGPIVGPVIAALAFGWLPAVLWIIVGAILIGGVHDFTVMAASIRNEGRSIGQICKAYLSRPAYYMFLFFILFTLIYVIIVFLDITAGTFVPAGTAAHVEGSEQVQFEARQGGIVASASAFYILLAVLFGQCIYRLKMPTWLGTVIFVPLVFAGLWIGGLLPLTADLVPPFLGSAKNTWCLVLMIYCLFAALLPVWVLLQPRDYLSSYLLYACLLGGAVGLVASGLAGRATVAYPAFLGFTHAKMGFLFPALFITIACGAVSGFHSIVSSGTSAKQLDRETSARKVGYGSMLVEGVLALLAVATVMILAKAPAGETPVVTFGRGLGSFVETLGMPSSFASTFAMMAVSTFLLTTLDSCTRLARFIVEEIAGTGNRFAPRLLATLAVLVAPALVVFKQIPGPDGKLMPVWQAIWPAFGASNQLLAALALLVVYGWLKREGRRTTFVLLPMAFMCVTTMTALAQLAWKNLAHGGSAFIGGLSVVLFVLAAVVIAGVLATTRRVHVTPAA